MDSAPAQNAARETTFSSLQNKAFRKIWMASTLSQFGGFVHITAAAWLMTTLTTSTTLVALVQTVVALPVTVLALIAGATADVYNKRLQMLISITFSTLSVFALFALYRMDLLQPWSLLLLTGFLGAGGAFYGPAWQSSLIDVVPRKDLTSAISLNNLSMNVARCLGPAIAAELLVRAGADIAFLINGISFAFLIAAIFVWKGAPRDQAAPRENLLRAVGDGLRYFLISSPIRSTAVRAVIFTFSSSAIIALPPAMAIELGGGARALGAMLVGFGVGAMAGALSLAYVRAHISVNKMVLVSAVAMAAALGVFGLSTVLWLTIIALLVGGFFWVQVVSSLQLSIQMASPRWVVGRMVSILSMSFSAGIAAGSILWGALSDILGIQESVLIAAATMLLTGLLLRYFPFNTPLEADLEPHPANKDVTLPKLDDTVGPVVISVEYTVPKDNSQAFMRAIYDLRQVRVRDGARRWSLSQDIADNSKWIEQFQSPTWQDYVLRVSRRLAGDVAVQDAVLKLCEGAPFWHRRLERPPRAEPLDMSWK